MENGTQGCFAAKKALKCIHRVFRMIIENMHKEQKKSHSGFQNLYSKINLNLDPILHDLLKEALYCLT